MTFPTCPICNHEMIPDYIRDFDDNLVAAWICHCASDDTEFEKVFEQWERENIRTEITTSDGTLPGC